MTYISTRGRVPPIGFAEAVMMGMADDGGLLLPATIPEVRDRLDRWQSLEYAALACEILGLYIGDDLTPEALRALVRRSYESFDHPEVTPVREVGPVHVLELYHGPTLAFKDVALQFLGNLFEQILAETGRTLNILGATSGDTGSAAIHGVRGKTNINIFIMHPHRRVSRVQELQMTSVLDPNVHNIAIRGTFDDGQRVLKEIFTDLPFKTAYRLGAVNSVNWARVLAQIVYYFYAAFRVRERTGAAAVQVCVPTGNFGDIFAGWLALRMGAPIRRLVLATNENDILARFFRTGVYARGEVRHTLSPSMDIQVASNFERYLFFRVGEDPSVVRELIDRFTRTGRLDLPGADPVFVAGSADRNATLGAMRRYWRRQRYLPDPHTAVGLAVAESFLDPALPMVCLATAHPAKFPEAVRDALGDEVTATHERTAALFGRPTRCAVLPATREAVERFIAQTLGPVRD
ncbi:MAG: threonine synthase [Kiritimatiellaeota bacterium]|nr:threonine synthase [Kiritimatiellota bacterium]